MFIEVKTICLIKRIKRMANKNYYRHIAGHRVTQLVLIDPILGQNIGVKGAEVTILTAKKQTFDSPLDLKLPKLKGVKVIEDAYQFLEIDKISID